MAAWSNMDYHLQVAWHAAFSQLLTAGAKLVIFRYNSITLGKYSGGPCMIMLALLPCTLLNPEPSSLFFTAVLL
jgi:hypothetical protein